MTAAVLFLASAALILYVLFGYPLLLALWSRRERPVHRRFEPRTVSILLPVYNGEQWIRAKLDSILALDYPPGLLQILVVSDGSEDRTEDIVREYPRVQLIRAPRAGKAVALNAAMARATGEILFFTDVRQPLHPSSLRNLVSCFADPSVGVASGELVIIQGETREEMNVGLYWRYEKWIRIRLSRLDSVPGATGCIYAMRRELAAPIPPGTLLDDVYLPMRAFFRGYRVILDETAKAFDYPTSLRSEFRRKVRTLAGVYQVIGAFPKLLLWFHFLSHKFGRLLLPHAMIIAAVSSFWLPRGLWIGQALFYCLAAADLGMPERWPLKRITSPIRTFVVLCAAAFCAMSWFVRGGRDLWKQTTCGPPITGL